MKKIFSKNPDGVIREFLSITEAAKYFNTSTSNICKACNGTIKTIRGCQMSYDSTFDELVPNKTTAVAVFSVDPKTLGVTHYSSIREAYDTTGAIKVSDCCRGKAKTSKGLYWFYDTAENRENFKNTIKCRENTKTMLGRRPYSTISDDEGVYFFVYEHVNRINNKKYIGITTQKPERRWKNGNGYKNNTRFFNAITKYGWSNFDHNILAENTLPSTAFQMEKDLITKYKTTDPKYGYNNSTGGDVNFPSEATRKKLSESHKGQKNTGADIRRGRIVNDQTRQKMRKTWAEKKLNGYVANPLKNVVKYVVAIPATGEPLLFKNINEAMRYMEYKSTQHIRESIRGIRRTVGGYIWLEFNENQLVQINKDTTFYIDGSRCTYSEVYSKLKKLRGLLEYTFDKGTVVISLNDNPNIYHKSDMTGTARSVIAYNADGSVFKEFESVGVACREVGAISSSNIIYACKNNTKSFGYFWKYKKD